MVKNRYLFNKMNILMIFLVGLHSLSQVNGDFIGRQGVNFVKSGKKLFINGFNAYWMMTAGGGDPISKFKVTTAFQEASKQGLNVARCWAFNDGDFKPLQISPGVYDENVFKGLDFVVAEAQKNNIYLILSFVNNFNAYGGRKKYVSWANIVDKDEFYTNEAVKQFYKNHVKAIVTRKNTITGIAYKDDPTIFAWELMNEPRMDNPDPTGTTIQNWFAEMAKYVKSLDNSHMLEIGLEGFYGASVPDRKLKNNPSTEEIGTDFIRNNQIPEIDFSTIHIYPETWLGSDKQNDKDHEEFVDKWIQSHLEDSDNVLKKPFIIGEFGKSSNLYGYTIEKRNAYFAKIYAKVYESASKGGSFGGAIFWQLMTKGNENEGDGYQVLLERDVSTATIIAQQSKKLSQL